MKKVGKCGIQDGRFRSNKKQIVGILLIGIAVLVFVINAEIRGRAAERFAERVDSSKIYLEQMYKVKDYEVKKVEVVDLEDKALILKMFDERYSTTDRSGAVAQCPWGALKITLEEDGSIIEFYPATDSCESIFYEDDTTFFMISDSDRDNLDLLWMRYSFPVFPDFPYSNK